MQREGSVACNTSALLCLSWAHHSHTSIVVLFRVPIHLNLPVQIVQAGPVIDAGGIFEFARQQGMIKTVTA